MSAMLFLVNLFRGIDYEKMFSFIIMWSTYDDRLLKRYA